MTSDRTAGEGSSGGLRARSERLRALRSAWGMLAPSGLSAEKQAIAETGRALSEEVVAMLGDGGSDGDPAALALLDARLDQLHLTGGGIRPVLVPDGR